MSDLEPTPEEAKAIRALKRLAKNWPASLWLYAGNGGITILRIDAEGEQAVDDTGSVDQAFVVGAVEIPADGGGW